MFVGILAFEGCASEPLTASAAWVRDGVEVSANVAVDEVRIDDAQGRTLVRQRVGAGAQTVFVPSDLGAGTYTVRLTAGDQSVAVGVEVPPVGPWFAEVQPALGGPWFAAVGEVVVPSWGSDPQVCFRFTAGRAATTLPFEDTAVVLPAAGSRAVVCRTVSRSETLRIGEQVVTLRPQRGDRALLARHLKAEEPVFPADDVGQPDLGRPAFRVVLPSPVWQALLDRFGWDVRARSPDAPWGYVAWELVNDGETPVDLLIVAEVRDARGPVRAFGSRLRSADGGTGVVSALVRVPERGRSTAVLPVFVDLNTAQPGDYAIALTATPLGAAQDLLTRSAPLRVSAGDPWASAGFTVTLVAALTGLLYTGWRLPVWLRSASATDLMVNALFATTLFVVTSATDVVSIAVGAALGPFGSLLTGLLYDVVRTVLIATLLVLQPRPGTLALSILCAWLGRGVLMGSLSVVDLVYTGVSISTAESFAWLAGLTRGQPQSLVRLWLAFVPAGGLLTLSGLWMHVVLYRLTFAPWYIAMQVLVPGMLYVAVACMLARPFAASLRRVDT